MGTGRAITFAFLLAAQLPQAAQTRLAEAVKLASTGEFARAEAILVELGKSYPLDPEIAYRLGLVLLRQRKLPEASRQLEAAARTNPKAPVVWLAVAQVRLQLAMREEAVAAARRAYSLAPSDPAVRRALGMFYPQVIQESIRAEDPGAAVRIGKLAVAEVNSALLRNLLGRAYRLDRNPAVAVEEMQRAIRLDPDQPGYYADLAELFLDHRTPEPAVAVLEEAVRRFPKNAELLRLLGPAHYGKGDTQNALDAFLRITQIDPDSEVGYASLETLLPEAGDRLDEIIRELRGFSERRPSLPVGHFLLAQALALRSAGSPETEALLRKAIAVEPSFWPAHFELHKAFRSQGKLKEAAQALAKTVEINPDYAPAHYSLAQIYAQLGERELAVKHRALHHSLSARQREAAEARRRELPMLPYTLTR